MAIIGGMSVLKMNNLGAKLYKLEISPIAPTLKCRIYVGNACYYSLEKILSSHLLSKKFKANTYKTTVLYYQLYCMVMKLGLSL